MLNEYQDQSVWYELYELHPEASNIFQREEFIKDFDTWEQAGVYAVDNIPDGTEYRIKRVYGLSD